MRFNLRWSGDGSVEPGSVCTGEAFANLTGVTCLWPETKPRQREEEQHVVVPNCGLEQGAFKG